MVTLLVNQMDNLTRLNVDGDTVHMTVPFTKVDEENRTVTGFATLDNLDKQGHIVMPSASRNAFSQWQGNIREMHEKLAVGSAVDIWEDRYVDKDNDRVYNGIVVKAYISKGAESTWQKVLDGTLRGFSIGGKLHEAEKQYDEASGQVVLVIKSYELEELSLVDNPANPLANILTITKNAEGERIAKGMAVDMDIEHVWRCDDEGIIRLRDKDEEDLNCLMCEKSMDYVGWIEDTGDEDDLNESVGLLLKRNNNNFEKGGVNMAKDTEVNDDENIEKADEVEDTDEVEKSEDVSDAEEVDVEKSDEEEDVEKTDTDEDADDVEKAEEAEADDNDLAKQFADFAENVEKQISALNDRLDEVAKAEADEEDDVEKSDEAEAEEEVEKSADADDGVDLTAALEKLADKISTSFDDVSERLEKLEDASASRQSDERIEKREKDTSSGWGGAILPGVSNLNE